MTEATANTTKTETVIVEETVRGPVGSFFASMPWKTMAAVATGAVGGAFVGAKYLAGDFEEATADAVETASAIRSIFG